VGSIHFTRKETKDMKKTLGIVVVVALGLFVGAAVAFSYGPGFGPFGPGAAGRPGFGPPGFAGGFGPWGSASGLTSEQSAKLQAIREEALKEIAPLRDELFQKITDLRGLVTNRTPDEAKVSALQNEIQALQGELQEKGTKFRLEAQKVVPEPQDRFGASGPGPGFGPRSGFGPGRPW
jgi:Spy/CpxP family protein refolding chaperone